MTFASIHNHLVAVIAVLGAVFLLALLMIVLRKRPLGKGQPQEDDQAKRIEERLASGHFSRPPSSWRRKAVVVQEPSPEENKETEI